MKSLFTRSYLNTVASLAIATLGTSALAAKPTKPAKPDPQMQAVLDKLGTLGGKPIETLTAEEARKQPSPAEAVMALLKEQGKDVPEKPVKWKTSVLNSAPGH